MGVSRVGLVEQQARASTLREVRLTRLFWARPQRATRTRQHGSPTRVLSHPQQVMPPVLRRTFRDELSGAEVKQARDKGARVATARDEAADDARRQGSVEAQELQEKHQRLREEGRRHEGVAQQEVCYRNRAGDALVAEARDQAVSKRSAVGRV